MVHHLRKGFRYRSREEFFSCMRDFYVDELEGLDLFSWYSLKHNGALRAFDDVVDEYSLLLDKKRNSHLYVGVAAVGGGVAGAYVGDPLVGAAIGAGIGGLYGVIIHFGRLQVMLKPWIRPDLFGKDPVTIAVQNESSRYITQQLVLTDVLGDDLLRGPRARQRREEVGDIVVGSRFSPEKHVGALVRRWYL